MPKHWISFRVLAVALVTTVGSTASVQGQQAQPAKRVEISVFTKVGTITDDLWGLDGYYPFNERVGAFGTLTVVDSVGMSGWMADGGIRFGTFQVWKMLYVNMGVGVRVKDLTDGTRVRAITDTRVGLRLGHIVPFFASRYPWPYLSEPGETVWGVAVALW